MAQGVTYHFETFQIPGRPPVISNPLTVWRPIVRVELRGPRRHLRTRVLLDTGSDLPLFDAALLPALGFPAGAGLEASATGVGGRAAVRYVPLRYQVLGPDQRPLGPIVETPAGFASRLPVSEPRGGPRLQGLLGRNDFFARFRVSFDLPDGRFTIRPA